MSARLQRIEHKIDMLEYGAQGGRAVYVGNNRVLMKIVVGGRNMAFYVEADDRLLSPGFIITGAYETDLTDYLLSGLKPDSHCIDVGSNFGYFTCLMGAFAPKGRTIGVEVDHKVYQLARDNVFINNLQGHATMVHAAASDSDADMTLYRRTNRSGNTSIANYGEAFTEYLGEPPTESFVVKGVRVDDLATQLQNRVDFMKVDVEGAEPLVFAGAEKTIAAHPNLKIVMEWSPGQITQAGFEISAFLAQLAALDLKAFDLHVDGLMPLSFDEIANIPYRAGIVLTRTP
jgi:FkbM family methyltransferase